MYLLFVIHKNQILAFCMKEAIMPFQKNQTEKP